MFLEVLKRVAVLDVCLLKRVKKNKKHTPQTQANQLQTGVGHSREIY